MPVGIRGSGKLMPRSNTAIHPGVIEVEIGGPLRFPAGGGPAARRQAMTMVRDALCRLTGLPALGDTRRSVPPRPIDGAGAGDDTEREAAGGATPARGRS